MSFFGRRAGIGSGGLVTMLGAILGGCGDSAATAFAPENQTCSIPNSQIIDVGVGKDRIPALTNPLLVEVGASGTEYLRDRDRVIGIVLDGQPIAVPHNIGWWHEIVNLDVGSHQIAVTFCPLTGSSLVFDRTAIGGAELGVSGLLYLSNLIMYDRGRHESLWPQMLRGARCGPRDGTPLEVVPALEMTWAGWKHLHPDALVVADDPRRERDYQLYPYGSYEWNSATLVPVPDSDRRRPLKERVLGIPNGEDRAVVFPFNELNRTGVVGAVHAMVQDREMVVFWDRHWSAAVAHYPSAGGQRLTFEARSGSLVDVQTESVWQVNGRAISGPLAGEQLEAVADAFVAFWFAWTAFYPNLDLWQSGS